MKLYYSIGLVLLLMNPSFVHSNEGDNAYAPGGGVVYGKNHAFAIRAPKGWILDNKSGVGQGLHAVFYPEGFNWQNSPVMMYVNTAVRKEEDSLEKFIASDMEEFRKKNGEKLIIERGASISIDKNKEAKVLLFTGDRWRNYESVAYIPENKIFIMIVLSSRNHDDYLKSKEAFQTLVRSYKFLTEDFRIEK